MAQFMFTTDCCRDAFAVIRVSMKDKTVSRIDNGQDIEHLNMAKNSKNQKKDDGTSNLSKSSVDAIWKCLGLNKIDILYACVGYTTDGRPVLDHSLLIDLLVQYGFLIQHVLDFIDDFIKQSSSDSSSPIIMYSSSAARIMSEVEPIISS